MGNTLNNKENPKASATGYNNYLRLYRQRHLEMEPSEAVMSAARAWSALSVKQKHHFAQLDTVSSKRSFEMRDVLQSAAQIAQPVRKRQRKRKLRGSKKNQD